VVMQNASGAVAFCINFYTHFHFDPVFLSTILNLLVAVSCEKSPVNSVRFGRKQP